MKLNRACSKYGVIIIDIIDKTIKCAILFLLTAMYLVPFHITIATKIGRNLTIDNSMGTQFSIIRIIARIAILYVINVVILFSFGVPSIYLET